LTDFFQEPWQPEFELKSAAEGLYKFQNDWFMHRTGWNWGRMPKKQGFFGLLSHFGILQSNPQKYLQLTALLGIRNWPALFEDIGKIGVGIPATFG